MPNATVTEGVTLSVEISETTYEMLLQELAGQYALSFDDAADRAIAQWVEARRNHRRMNAKLLLEAA